MSQREIGQSTAKPGLAYDKGAETRSSTIPTDKLKSRFAACLQTTLANKASALRLPDENGELDELNELDELDDTGQLSFMVGSCSPWEAVASHNGFAGDFGGGRDGALAVATPTTELPLEGATLRTELPAELLSPGGEYSDGIVALSRGDGIQLTYTLLNGPSSGLTILASLAAGNNLRLQMLVRDRSDYDYLKTRHHKLMAAISGCRYNVVLDIRHVASVT